MNTACHLFACRRGGHRGARWQARFPGGTRDADSGKAIAALISGEIPQMTCAFYGAPHCDQRARQSLRNDSSPACRSQKKSVFFAALQQFLRTGDFSWPDRYANIWKWHRGSAVFACWKQCGGSSARWVWPTLEPHWLHPRLNLSHHHHHHHHHHHQQHQHQHRR